MGVGKESHCGEQLDGLQENCPSWVCPAHKFLFSRENLDEKMHSCIASGNCKLETTCCPPWESYSAYQHTAVDAVNIRPYQSRRATVNN
jgi:hypothetical protein